MSVRRLAFHNVGVGGSTPWQEDPPSSDPDAIVGARLINGDEVVRELATLPPVAAPPGFRRLSAGVIQSATHDLQLRRGRTDPGTPPRRIGYRPTGDFHTALATWGSAELAAGVNPRPKTTLIWVDLVGPSAPRSYGYTRSAVAAAEEAHALALADVRALGAWHVHDDGRCWRAGDPWPENLEPVHEALSASVVRTVMRHVRTRVERSGLPPSVLADVPCLVFDTDGTCFGSTYPVSEHYVGRDTDTFIRIRCTSDDPGVLDAIEAQLHQVRVVQPSGRVVVLDEVPT
jgi:hypothetical protein